MAGHTSGGRAVRENFTPSPPRAALRGHLDALLLATLLNAGPAHGYAITASLRETSGGTFDLPEGTVYPALHRLERDGLVDSEFG